MAVYQIDYDLRNQRDYQALYERIQSYGVWCRPLQSTWIIQTSQSAEQVRDHIFGAMDRDDGLLVTRLFGEAAWRNIDNDVSSYLKDMLERRAA